MVSMKVSGVFQPYEAYGVNKAANPHKSEGKENKKDVVALSEQAKEYQAVSKVLTELPDIRQDVVSGIKVRMESGSYNVSPHDVAMKLVNNWAALD